MSSNEDSDVNPAFADFLSEAGQQGRAPGPFAVEPGPGQEATYTLTLDDDLLDKLFDPQTPIYHAFPGRKTDDDEIPVENAPAHSVLAGVKVINTRAASIYTALRNALKRHPDFGEATTSWQATAPPNAPQDWKIAEDLGKHLKATLFTVVGAILKFLPDGNRLDIIAGDGPTDVLITATLPATATQRRKGETPTPRVIMVIDIVPWLRFPRMEHMATASGEISPSSLLRLPWWKRANAETHNVALQRLGLRMRARNAPVGILYNGCDVVVVERDFEHDLKRLRQLKSPRKTRSSALSDGDDIALDLQLAVWSPCFRHPGDSLPCPEAFRVDNPAALVAALALFALDRVKGRPDALDDDKLKKAIQQFLLRTRRCPCQARAPNGVELGEGSREEAAGILAACSAKGKPPTLPLPISLSGLLQRIKASPVQREDDAAEQEGDTDADDSATDAWLIAVGNMPCYVGGTRPYILVSRNYPHRQRFTEVYMSRLFVVTEASKAAGASEALTSALMVARTSPSGVDQIGGQHHLSVQPDHLYRASLETVHAAKRALEAVCGNGRIFQQRVEVKLPNLAGRSWLSRREDWKVDASDARARGALAAQGDQMLCKCPRGLCDSVCSGCRGSSHEYALAAAQRHIESLILSFKVEHAALVSLAGAYKHSEVAPAAGNRRPSFSRIIALHLPFKPSKAALSQNWPALTPLLERSWPVYLDRGEPISIMMEYANVRYASHPMPENFLWSETPDDLEGPHKVFAYFADDGDHVRIAMEEIEQQFNILRSRDLGPPRVDSNTVYASFHSQRSLDLFAGAVQGAEECWVWERLFATLVDLSDCQYWGDFSALDIAEEEAMELGSKPRGLPLSSGDTAAERHGADTYQDMLDEELGEKWQDFTDAWHREVFEYDYYEYPHSTISGSAAPVAHLREDEWAVHVAIVDTLEASEAFDSD